MNLKLLLFLIGLNVTVSAQADFSLHLATQQDLPACVGLLKDVVSKIYRPILGLNDAQFEKVLREEINESCYEPYASHKVGALVVAQDASHKIIGCILGTPFFQVDYVNKTSPSFMALQEIEKCETMEQAAPLFAKHSDGSAAYLFRFYVDEEWRGKGVGKALLASLLSYFPSAKKIYLDTLLGNVAALAFYKRLGFVEVMREHVGLPNETVVLAGDYAGVMNCLESKKSVNN